MSVTKPQLRKLLGKLARSRFRYLDVQEGSLHVIASVKEGARPSAAAGGDAASDATERSGSTVPKPSIPSPAIQTPQAQVVTAETMRSPRVGHIFLSVKTGEPPLLKVGSKVVEGQVVAIIESMHLKYEVKADRSGVVEEMLVEDAEAVEYGQPLARLAKAPEAK